MNKFWKLAAAALLGSLVASAQVSSNASSLRNKPPCSATNTANCVVSTAADGSLAVAGIGADVGLAGDSCFLGDSITSDSSGTYYVPASGYLGTGWTSQLPVLSLQSVYAASPLQNFGVPGNTTGQMLSRIADVLTQSCRKVFVLAGTNDVAQGISKAQIAENLAAIYTYLRAHGRQPIACTLPPNNNTVAAVQQANVIIRSLARQYQVPLVDFYGVLASTAGTYLSSAGALDGVHPGPPGHRMMAQAVISQLGALFPPPIAWLPTTTTDGINLVANPLMGSCIGGIPGGWNAGYGTGSPPSVSCAADAAIPGQWFQSSFTVNTGSSGYYALSAASSITNIWFQGDTLLFVGRVQASGLESTGSTLDIKCTGAGAGAWFFNYGADISNGVFALTFPAPDPSTPLAVSVVFHYGHQADATAVVKLAQVGVINLTALGIQTR